ncbi:hypothetical protein B4113_4162 [Geobacillus sp. B4113_201601]|nr:hypothetical protein B4113_4162 [Geobacillus sp. B4113_201601]
MFFSPFSFCLPLPLAYALWARQSDADGRERVASHSRFSNRTIWQHRSFVSHVPSPMRGKRPLFNDFLGGW